MVEEIRCGYTISEKQKKIWEIELDLTEKYLSVCKKYNIKTMAFAGTLLGAIRHKGFIPWDDDIDFCLTRQEFEKLKKVAVVEFEDPYFFQTNESDPEYFCGYARLRNSNTTGIITGNESINYNNGIYIDVFVLDGYIDNLIKIYIQRGLLDILKRISMWYVTDLRKDRANIIKRLIKRALIPIILVFLKMFHITRKDVLRKYDDVISMYTNETSRVSLMTHPSFFFTRYWCDKRSFDDIMWVDFENIKIPIPANYHEMLKNMYGEYMKFPPIEKRGAWHEGLITFEPDIAYTDYLKTFLK